MSSSADDKAAQSIPKASLQNACLTAVGLWLVGLVTFACTAIALQSIQPVAGVPIVEQQVARAHQRTDASAIFMGSSLTRRGVDSAVFDARMRELGISVRSINCAVDGLTMPEILFVADQVLAAPNSNLRWLILEASQLRAGAPENATKRDVYWRTPELTVLSLRRLVSADRKLAEGASRGELARRHLELFCQRFGNVGRSWDVLPMYQPKDKTELPPLSATYNGTVYHSDDQGFLGIDEDVAEDQREGLRKAIAGIPNLWARAEEDTLAAKALLKLARRLQRRNVQLILVQPPDTKRVPAPYPSVAREAGVPQLNFMDPQRFPELYAADCRYDARHLNRRGAAVFSRRLAEALAAHTGSSATGGGAQ